MGHRVMLRQKGRIRSDNMRKRAILVCFDGCAKAYAYGSYDGSIREGDMCLVGVGGNSDMGSEIKVAKVARVSTREEDLAKARKMVLSKVDFSQYLAGYEYERRLADLRMKAERRYSQIEEMAKWKLVADADEEMRSILRKLEALEKGSDDTEISSDNGTKGE